LQAIKRLSDELGTEKLLVLEYHTKDTWASRDTEALYEYYDPEGTPTVYFNGGNEVAGGGDSDYLYSRYKKIVTRESAVEPVIGLAVSRSVENEPGTVVVRLTNGTGNLLEDVVLCGVAYQDFGTERHYFLASDMSMVPVAGIPAGSSVEIALFFETRASELSVAVFLKSAAGDVIQAALLPGVSQLWLP
jgi:hypothetical protein